MKKRKFTNKGFTMIEVLAVVVILGIIAGIAIPSVFRYVQKSRTQAYKVMQDTIYDGARNFILDENRYLPLCENGYSDIENEDNMLVKLQYVENLVDPANNAQQCTYNVYGCMENQPSMDSLATYKYKVQLNCTDYKNCAIYREDGTILPCEDNIDDTNGPTCGSYTSSNTSWSAVDFVNVSLNCVNKASGSCAQPVYNQTFTSEGKSANIEIKDIFGNKTVCPVDIYIDRSAPSKPIITNPYENKWINKSYSIQISSVDTVSGIKYFEYRYPNSSKAEEREWKQWKNSSKAPLDSTPFTTTKFSLERNEYVEVRACDYAGNCSETSQSMIKIDKTAPTTPVLNNPYNGIWAGADYVNVNKYVIGVTSSDSASGIQYYQYRYPNSENVWHTYANSSGNSFTTTPFTRERNEIVDIRACDNAGNCSQPGQNTIMIDKTAPICTISLSGTGGSGSYTSAVTIKLITKDPGASSRSGISYGLINSNTATYNGTTSATQGETNGITWYGFIKDEAGNVNNCNSGNFKVTLPITVPDNKLLRELILQHNPDVKTNPTLTATSSFAGENGLYKSTNTNDNSATYYFRGAINNNYVSFAGMTWRVIRINEDGTVRLILNNAINGGAYYKFNSSASNYSCIYYSNSDIIKPVVDSWYSDNLSSFDSYISLGSFCEQLKVATDSTHYIAGNVTPSGYRDYIPDFKCTTDANGKGIIKSKVGLITYDEVVHAGGYGTGPNLNYYLNDDTFYWMMSPAGFVPFTSGDVFGNGIAHAWYINGSSYVNGYTNVAGTSLRPVISLNEWVLATGSGTSDDPYVVIVNG